MPHKGYFNKIFNTCVALPHILLKTIITCKRMRNQNKRRKKRTKQHNHNYEICLIEMIKKEPMPNSHISNV